MRTLQLIIFCFITLLSSFAQSNSNIKITWIDTPNEVSESVLTVKWGIKADSQIKDVNILLNGQQTKGINAVSNDGYDMKKSRVFNLTKGENKIEITVTTLTGSQKATKVIKKIKKDRNKLILDYLDKANEHGTSTIRSCVVNMYYCRAS